MACDSGVSRILARRFSSTPRHEGTKTQRLEDGTRHAMEVLTPHFCRRASRLDQLERAFRVRGKQLAIQIREAA
jgi:hypothetical protein